MGLCSGRVRDAELPDVPMRQWVLALPYTLRGLVAVRADVMGAIAKIFVEEVFRWQRSQVAGTTKLHGAALLVPQRFGGSLQLSPHLHAIFTDGVYDEQARFERTPVPTSRDLDHVASRIAERSARWLRRRGYTFDESPSDHQPDFAEQSAQASLRLGELATVDDDGHVTPLGRRQERHRALKTKGVARGFDLHADVTVRQGDRAGRERLCRYILRPPLVLERLSLTADGRVAYERKYQSAGASHVVMTPTEFLARLSALVFPPRHPILRYHGIFAANHKLRARVVPNTPPEQRADARTPKRAKSKPTPVEHSVAAADARPTNNEPLPGPSDRTALALVNQPLDWAALLKRIYDIDALACPCGARLRFVALVTEPEPIANILRALDLDPTPPARAPPKQPSLPWLEPP
jgi:hypothetical protein